MTVCVRCSQPISSADPLENERGEPVHFECPDSYPLAADDREID